MKKILLLALPLTLILVGCSSSSDLENLDAAAFSQKVNETGVVVLDVRTPGEFMAGHIQGAINIDVEGAQFDSEIATLDKTKTYAVYCKSGRRSAIAVGKMKDTGFTKIFNLQNGVADWQSNGLPLVRQ